ncbi:hypothetical protein, partial [Burkholderia glumae]|uniref:hypothetical protein n=1 Tax=Burkholderia glumae TaxID=337 RepID=UPI001E54BD04
CYPRRRAPGSDIGGVDRKPAGRLWAGAGTPVATFSSGSMSVNADPSSDGAESEWGGAGRNLESSNVMSSYLFFA